MLQDQLVKEGAKMTDPTVPISFVTWLLGAIIAVLGGCWAIFKFFESKLNTVYKRIDENKAAYYKDFVLIAVFRESNDARKELTDQKFESLIQLFNEKIESLRSEIKNISIAKSNQH
jgi:hypothetical protein